MTEFEIELQTDKLTLCATKDLEKWWCYMSRFSWHPDMPTEKPDGWDALSETEKRADPLSAAIWEQLARLTTLDGCLKYWNGPKFNKGAALKKERTIYAYPTKREGKHHHQCEPAEATHLWFQFANEDHPRCLPIQIKGTRAGAGNWTWNGNQESPTLRPSLLTTMGEIRCHVWINDGIVEHLGDCTCGMAGKKQHLAVPEVTDYFRE